MHLAPQIGALQEGTGLAAPRGIKKGIRQKRLQSHTKGARQKGKLSTNEQLNRQPRTTRDREALRLCTTHCRPHFVNRVLGQDYFLIKVFGRYDLLTKDFGAVRFVKMDLERPGEATIC